MSMNEAKKSKTGAKSKPTDGVPGFANMVVAVHLLKSAGLEQDAYEDWIIPGTGWSDKMYTILDKANYTAYLKHYSPWVKESESGHSEGAVIDHKKLYTIPLDTLTDIIYTIKRQRDDYPIVDEYIFSETEDEARTEAWEDGGRAEFIEVVKRVVEPYFEGEFTDDGTPRWDIVDDFLDNNPNFVDKLFWSGLIQKYSGYDLWYEDGSFTLRAKDIEEMAVRDNLGKVWARELRKALWPPDPRQLELPLSYQVVECLLDGVAAEKFMFVPEAGAGGSGLAFTGFSADPAVFSAGSGRFVQSRLGTDKAKSGSVSEDDKTTCSSTGGEGQDEHGCQSGVTGEHGVDPSDIVRKVLYKYNRLPLRSVRNLVSKRLLNAVEIFYDTSLRYPSATARFRFDDGYVADVDFASLGVLAQCLRHWRNLYGVPVYANGEPIGTVQYRNPTLTRLAR